MASSPPEDITTKPKTAGAAGVTIGDQLHFVHGAVFLERLAHGTFIGIIGQVANIDILAHGLYFRFLF